MKFSLFYSFPREMSYFLRSEKGPSCHPSVLDLGTDFVPVVLKALLLAWMVSAIALCSPEHFCPQVVPSAPLQVAPKPAFGASFTFGFSPLQAKVTAWLELVWVLSGCKCGCKNDLPIEGLLACLVVFWRVYFVGKECIRVNHLQWRLRHRLLLYF